MILDIRYKNRPPEQIQNVRMHTVYTQSSSGEAPEVIIHSHFKPPRYIKLSDIITIQSTND